MNITLNDQLRSMEETIKQCLSIIKRLRDSSHELDERSTSATITSVRAEYFSKLVSQVLQTIKLIDSGDSYIDMTDYDHNKLVADAEQKLTELYFGGYEWLRQYGYIEGLKQVKFYTKNLS